MTQNGNQMSSEVESVVAGLSKSEIALLICSAQDVFAIDDANRRGSANARKLAARGLIFAQLSPLGLEVAAHLSRKDEDHEG